jgi:hypothetical protein
MSRMANCGEGNSRTCHEDLIKTLRKSLPFDGRRRLEVGDYDAVEASILRTRRSLMWLMAWQALILMFPAAWYFFYRMPDTRGEPKIVLMSMALILLGGSGAILSWWIRRRSLLRSLWILTQLRSTSR